MATINMCDRCGALGMENAVGTLVAHASPNGKTEKREICPDCFGEFMAWLLTTPTRNNVGPFREPWKAQTSRELETSENQGWMVQPVAIDRYVAAYNDVPTNAQRWNDTAERIVCFAPDGTEIASFPLGTVAEQCTYCEDIKLRFPGDKHDPWLIHGRTHKR